MAISRSLMNRQLRANGGIMQVAPREKFGLGSKLKKFVRNIIPNEVAEIAVKAAPFVAPFNPALAAGMSGLGTFDKTGSIGDSLKAGGLNYAGGQAARYIGGAGFQGNPFQGGLDGTLQNFTSFSSPIGSKTGLGKFFSNRGTPEIQGIDMQTGGADGVGVIGETPTKTTALASEVSYVPETGINMATGGADGVGIIQDTVLNKTVVTKDNPSFLKDLFDGVSNQDYGKIAKTIGDSAKKFGKAMFTNKDGSIDKAAVMGAVAFAGSYVEALALANEAGLELTEDEYNEAVKEEKREEYAGYLTNFFGGKAEGGRIGFKDGTPDANKFTYTMEDFDIIKEPEVVLVSLPGPDGIQLEKMLKSDAIKYGLNIVADSFDTENLEGNTIDLSVLGKKNGGRIGFKKGSPEEPSEIGIMSIDVEAGDDEDDMDDLMAGITFSSAEKSYLFRKLAGQGGASRSYTMPNLYRILSNPNRYPNDAAILKEIAIMGMKKDGGRIKFSEGSNLMTLKVKEMWEAEGEDDPLGTIVKMGLTFRAPIVDLVKMIGVTASTAAGLVADVAKLGYDVTEPIRDVVSDVAGGIYDVGKDLVKGSKTDTRFIQPLYYLQRFGGEKPLTDEETQLKMMSNSVGRDDPKKRRELENIVFGFDDAGMNQRPEDKEVSETIKFKEKYNFADGGRIMYASGANRVSELLILRDSILAKDANADVSDIEAEIFQLTGKVFKSTGGIGDVPTGKIRQNSVGVIERDYRDEGGFVPVGVKERADDVPAMLSKNEFVMTADAVRGIGGGDVEKGSKKLYNTMKQAEKVGRA